MKTLKIVIFCWIVFIFGAIILVKLNAQEAQDKSMGEVIVLYPDKEIRVTIGDKEYITNYQYMMFLGLMGMYYEMKQYRAECFPDSVEFYPPNTFIKLDPSFNGFIRYLDEKYKQ